MGHFRKRICIFFASSMVQYTRKVISPRSKIEKKDSDLPEATRVSSVLLLMLLIDSVAAVAS